MSPTIIQGKIGVSAFVEWKSKSNHAIYLDPTIAGEIYFNGKLVELVSDEEYERLKHLEAFQ